MIVKLLRGYLFFYKFVKQLLSKYVVMKLPRSKATGKLNVICAQNGSIYNISCCNFAVDVRYFAFSQKVGTIFDTTLKQWNVMFI